jgi:hypothetical protein
MDPFVQQLAHLCRKDVTRCKWVFVPFAVHGNWHCINAGMF